MKPRSMIKLVAVSFLFLACGKTGGPESRPPSTATVGEIKDTSLKGINEFLQLAGYKSWAAEPEVHVSAGPHGKVRSYFNETLASSLKEKNTLHPVGSIAVKELYASDGITLNGYAVEGKTSDVPGGDAWLWYEGFFPELNQYYGQGLSTCIGCHSSGVDFVTSAPGVL